MVTRARHQQNCLTSLSSLMVHITEAVQDVEVIKAPLDGMTLVATMVRNRDMKPEREVAVNLPPEAQVYLIKSEVEDYRYIGQYSTYFGRYGCSCPTGRHYNETRKACGHMVLMAGVK